MDNSPKYLKSFNPNKTAQQLLVQVEAWMDCEDTCHYFAIQEVDNVVQPFGFIDRPFAKLEGANLILEELKAENPDKDYFICAGALNTSSLDFDNVTGSAFYQMWVRHHQHRLIKLYVNKLPVPELSKLIGNYEETIAWQEKNNTKDVCHFYFAQSCDDAEREIGISAQHTIDLRTALAAKLYFEKIMPNRRFEINCGLMSTEMVMNLDGRTTEIFQDFVEEHKERIAKLDAVALEGA